MEVPAYAFPSTFQSIAASYPTEQPATTPTPLGALTAFVAAQPRTVAPAWTAPTFEVADYLAATTLKETARRNPIVNPNIKVFSCDGRTPIARVARTKDFTASDTKELLVFADKLIAKYLRIRAAQEKYRYSNRARSLQFLSYGGPVTEIKASPDAKTDSGNRYSRCLECGTAFTTPQQFSFCEETERTTGPCKRAWVSKYVPECLRRGVEQPVREIYPQFECALTNQRRALTIKFELAMRAAESAAQIEHERRAAMENRPKKMNDAAMSLKERLLHEEYKTTRLFTEEEWDRVWTLTLRQAVRFVQAAKRWHMEKRMAAKGRAEARPFLDILSESRTFPN
ncbi:MAG TPA: hypothetical protein VNO32_04230 [Candidatus Acidoferrum sp.]|nr:hypothetical protein [Candidatus Acidoferrum sp.]